MLPTTMSLFVPAHSASTMQGIPVEIYYYELIKCLSLELTATFVHS